MSKITAIHGGGDCYDASVEYLILPEGTNAEEEKVKYMKWYNEEYLHCFQEGGMLLEGNAVGYLTFFDWLENLGGIEPNLDQLEIVVDV